MVTIAKDPPDEVTVTCALAVVEAVEFVAFSVYVVVEVGLTLVDPVAEVDVNDPGVMEIELAPVVVQFSVLLAPEVMPAGDAEKELIAGIAPFAAEPLEPPQPCSPKQANTTIRNRLQ